MMSSSRKMSFTRRLPATSTSRRGLRRMTFTAVRPSRARESRRALDLADLGEMDAVVVRLQLPPLREIELTEPEVLELERTRIDGAELLDRLAAALARGPHRRQELRDRLAALGPDDLGRVRRAGAGQSRERLERGEVGGESARRT